MKKADCRKQFGWAGLAALRAKAVLAFARADQIMAQVMAQVMAWAMNDMNNAWPANSKYVHAELALVSA